MKYRGFEIRLKKIDDGYIASIKTGRNIFWKKEKSDAKAILKIKNAIDKFADELNRKTLYKLKKRKNYKR